ncbi:MAG: MerR family transcriptional regulator [Coriobacteriales bacterium]
MAYTVGEVARLAHVSVRALHHYDEIGLLRPSNRSGAGYRLYTDADVRLLQETLFLRELGFELADIRDLLGRPLLEKGEALAAQRGWLVEKRADIDRMIASIDRVLVSIQKGIPMAEEETFKASEGFDSAEHQEEARERWGETEAYQESERRAVHYTADDWLRIEAEAEAVYEKLLDAFDDELAPDSELAQDAVQSWWDQIDRNFYPMSLDLLADLGEMYVDDPRFAKHYEDIRPGLAVYWRDAIRAYVAARR